MDPLVEHLLAHRRVLLILTHPLLRHPVYLILMQLQLVFLHRQELQVDLLLTLMRLQAVLFFLLLVDPLDLLLILMHLPVHFPVDLHLLAENLQKIIRTRIRSIKTRIRSTRSTRIRTSTRMELILMVARLQVFRLLMLVLQQVFLRQVLLLPMLEHLQVHILQAENRLKSIRKNTRKKEKLVRKAIRRRRARRRRRRRRRRSQRSIVSIRSIISIISTMKMKKDWAKRMNNMNAIISVTGRNIVITGIALAIVLIGTLALAGMVQVLSVIQNTRDRVLVTMESMLLPRVDRLLCRFQFLR